MKPDLIKDPKEYYRKLGELQDSIDKAWPSFSTRARNVITCLEWKFDVKIRTKEALLNWVLRGQPIWPAKFRGCGYKTFQEVCKAAGVKPRESQFRYKMIIIPAAPGCAYYKAAHDSV